MGTRDDLKHLVLHFTRGQAWSEGRIPMYERGDGCYLWDDEGRRYLDGLAGLFVVQIGHGRRDIAEAMGDQAMRLAYTPSWSATHPTAVEAAKLIAGLAPGDLDSVFFVSSGSEAVESAIKFSRQYHAAKGNPGRTKVIARINAYHGTTMGALSATGLAGIREPFQPLLPGFSHVPNTLGYDDGVACARLVEEEILRQGPEHVGLVIAEPVQNGGGAICPPAGYWQELRAICDRHGVLLVADEVINSFGRLGTWFGSDHVGVTPDLLTFAKGATSGYAPIGGLLIRSPLVDELMSSSIGTFNHGATWGGHPVAMAATIANLTAMRDEKVVENCAENQDWFRRRLDDLSAAHDVVMDVRGTGYFYALTLGQSRAGGVELTPEQTAEMVGSVLPELITDAGLLIRADDRGGPKLMLSPPLIAGQGELEELVEGVSRVLDGMKERLAG